MKKTAVVVFLVYIICFFFPFLFVLKEEVLLELVSSPTSGGRESGQESGRSPTAAPRFPFLRLTKEFQISDLGFSQPDETR